MSDLKADRPQVVIHKVSEKTIEEHNLYVLKQCTQICHDKELAGGNELTRPPVRQPRLPPHVIKTRMNDDKDAYFLGKRDPGGDTKVDRHGRLLGGRNYLVDTFQLPEKTHNFYVLVDDLIKVLHFQGSGSEFLELHNQLYPLELTDNERASLVDAGLAKDEQQSPNYVTALSSYILFGAAIVASGCRIIDDYWEQVLKEQGFTMHHRVFSLSDTQLALLRQLKPPRPEPQQRNEELDTNWLQKWEDPYPTIQEQPNAETRREYAREHSRGEHITMIVPGQSISGGIELSLNYKLPKYHYKNSFANALQNNIQDVPIGQHRSVETTPNAPVGRPSKRTDEQKDHVSERDHSLNINGWKFEAIPLAPPRSNPGRTSKGLPYYEKEKLLQRLRRLTPNQVRELEYLHDSVHLNTGLGKIRQNRRLKWSKYWQYKAGAPVGITADQVKDFREKYLPALLNQVDTEIIYDEERNLDIIHSTHRRPNANFFGHSNINGFKPPYKEDPKYK
ncbi:AaceriABR244Cp [[Ashbya] aceris (nom. inval.)]|nr:AaceriABR244Cp [[Ashbya] aceris (nom. inval.)]